MQSQNEMNGRGAQLLSDGVPVKQLYKYPIDRSSFNDSLNTLNNFINYFFKQLDIEWLGQRW